MKKTYFLIGIIALFILFSIAPQGISQVPFFPFYWGMNPYLPWISPVPISPLLAPIYSPLTYFPTPVFSPLSRVGAATIIITNPTAGTVSIINPTVAAAPVVTAVAPPAPAPLLSVLAPLYASLLYESPLTTANPLLNALLQNIFLL